MGKNQLVFGIFCRKWKRSETTCTDRPILTVTHTYPSAWTWNRNYFPPPSSELFQAICIPFKMADLHSSFREDMLRLKMENAELVEKLKTQSEIQPPTVHTAARKATVSSVAEQPDSLSDSATTVASVSEEKPAEIIPDRLHAAAVIFFRPTFESIQINQSINMINQPINQIQSINQINQSINQSINWISLVVLSQGARWGHGQFSCSTGHSIAATEGVPFIFDYRIVLKNRVVTFLF